MVGLRSILCPALYSSCRSQGRGGCGTAQSSHHCGACFPEATRPVPAPWGTGSSRSAPSRGWGQWWRAIRCLDLCTPHWSLVLLPPPPRPLSVQVPGPLSPVPGGGYLGPMAPRRPRAGLAFSPPAVLSRGLAGLPRGFVPQWFRRVSSERDCLWGILLHRWTRLLVY